MAQNPNVLAMSDYGPMIINAHDQVIGRHIVDHGYWSKDDIDLLKSLVRHRIEKQGSAVFYDIGANIGTHTLAIAKTFAADVKVRSFEAQRQIYQMLCGTMALNGLSNVHAHNAAVADEAGHSIEIELLDYNASNNFGALELIPPLKSDQAGVSKVGSEVVRTVSVDSFGEKVDLMKIDVEGMEDRVIMGSRNTIERYSPILFIEIHKTNAESIIEYLSASEKYVGYLKGIDVVAIPLSDGVGLNGAGRVF